ncbi:MAG: hypothetical protein LQ338_007844 [Usnochroma carphineum]|nr:MAG: hypothetical protein LQ338_007844 [Usnochroma carphineum]
MKIMTDNAAFILWIHGGGNMNATRPDLAMPSPRFLTYDIDDPEANTEASITNILATIDDLHDDNCLDLEVVEKKSIPFFQRFVPDEGLNATFRQKLGNRTAEKTLGEAKPARLTIHSLGQFDTLAFAPELEIPVELTPDSVEVEVKSVGLNAKDVYVYSGKVDTQSGRLLSSRIARSTT